MVLDSRALWKSRTLVQIDKKSLKLAQEVKGLKYPSPLEYNSLCREAMCRIQVRHLQFFCVDILCHRSSLSQYPQSQVVVHLFYCWQLVELPVVSSLQACQYHPTSFQVTTMVNEAPCGESRTELILHEIHHILPVVYIYDVRHMRHWSLTLRIVYLFFSALLYALSSCYAMRKSPFTVDHDVGFSSAVLYWG